MNAAPIPFKNKLGKDQLFKISRFKEKIKKTRPHKHGGYHELIYLTQGEGYHWIETEKFKIEAPELYFLQSGQLHCWQFTSIPRGYVILFKEEFFNFINEASILNLMKNLTSVVNISMHGQQDLTFIFEDIIQEFNSGNEFSDQVINGYLRVLFSKLLQLSSTNATRATPNLLFDRFQKMITEKCPDLRNVNDFAQELQTTRQQLNSVCRRHSGKSASDHITGQLLLEAKRYILHTEKSMSEIAHLLNFNDTSYFIRFFKRHERVTPLQFRAQYFQ
ncbi:AraC family transcriptional regulator [Flavilitoribacter nigricans]|uniref:DNA-binding protein n=1 Tax=Flavilitoribacter nigricans (strain ATCC 23147 / DSM 23189 / NBRC 102662 / NCIMB 1420 / SS-2) TaxID=1122177 RepID=A0A2D0N6M8_FLAN2|nr:AraC family transcriptional regulator [Flavilitoribacter nigricans]PHN04171.1 DNA-binding protein [Flavilitoribacter nigricans DSM 23189 = NBRC 102662]